ncbi:MAG: hypothetical protein B7Y50_03070 [Hydrogenophilales bacterium 28-61-11]|nr:MAG: hypothetical protein B7Y50_03070 [Hydrogenophilales bacterium 28-61-11]OYZ57822.1 MAG: hypothetical protein B7Y21_06335 [Hydrogenophilales bacterium 16-61-112]OZA48575.1 MAG: hypothetical protein B7X81_03835 [Hydrogenophilales bacterium 17-61-76]
MIVGSGVFAASAFAMNGAADGKPGCEMCLSQAMQAKMDESRDARMAAVKEKLNSRPLRLPPGRCSPTPIKSSCIRRGADRKAMREAHAKMNTPQWVDAMLARANTCHAHQVVAPMRSA